jgi:RNA polymerase sigma factor (sigma-70 family)
MARQLSDSHLHDHELTRIIAHASRAAARSTQTDPDDFQQELFLQLLQSDHRYDPERGTRAAFVATLTHRHRVDLQRRAMSGRGRFYRQLFTGRKPPDEQFDNRESPERLELRRDVTEWLTTLSDELRTVAEALKSSTLSDLARERGTPRSTLQRQVRQLRTAFDRYQSRDF